MQKTKLPNLISILILTVLTSVMWISLNIYRALTTKPTPVVTQVISEPLTPTLDTATITKVESSLFLSKDQIPQNVVTATNAVVIPPTLPTSTPLPSPEASVSAEPSPTPTGP